MKDEDRVHVRRMFIGLGLYFSCHVLVRVLISDSLELDEAEQVVLAQWFLPGYWDQLPLYTWFQILFFKAFGTSVFALSILKNSLLFMTYAFVFKSARMLHKDVSLAILSTLSLLLMSEIGWQSQRDLTHSVMALTISAATFYIMIRLGKGPRLVDYLLFGLLLGLGAITKYNYLLFPFAMFLSLVSLRAERTKLLNRRMLISFSFALLIALPCLIWSVLNQNIGTSSMENLHTADFEILLKGLGSLVLAGILFPMPFLLVCLALFPRAFTLKNRARVHTETWFPLFRYFIILFALLIALVLFFHISNFRMRWMQPLLFVVPVYFFLYVKQESLSFKSRKWFIRICTATASLILFAMVFRVVGASFIDPYTDFNYPYRTIADKARALGFDYGVIISARRINAGNLRLQFPQSLVLDPGIDMVFDDSEVAKCPLLVFWDTKKSKPPPETLRNYTRKVLGVDFQTIPISYIDVPFYHSDESFARVGLIVLPSRSCGLLNVLETS